MKDCKSMLLAGMLLAGVSSAAWAETYKVAHPFATTHYLAAEGVQVFADEVAALSGGKITLDIFPGGQLGKDYFTLLQTNISDMALISTSQFSAERFPLTSVTELPGLHSSSCEGTAKYWSLAQPGGELDKLEYAPQNLHLLFVALLPPYAIMTTKKPVLKMEDIAGLKLRGVGGAQELTLTELGAVPVQVVTTEVYDSVTRGTIDGALYPFSGVPANGLEKSLRYAAIGPKLGAASTTFTMTTEKWNSLPPETQEIFTTAAAKAQEHLCQWLDKSDGDIQKNLVEAHGFTLNKLSDEEAKRWQDKIGSVAQNWAKRMDDRGLQGTAVLEAFEAAK